MTMPMTSSTRTIDSTTEYLLHLPTQAIRDLHTCHAHLRFTEAEIVTMALSLLSERLQAEAAESWQQPNLPKSGGWNEPLS
jgi:hypothetical protein